MSAPDAAMLMEARLLEIVFPDHTNGNPPERLKGLAWRVEAEARRDATRARNAHHRGPGPGLVTVLRKTD